MMMMSEASYKVLCSKDNVILKYKRYLPSDALNNPALKNTFLIDFEIVNTNPTIDLSRFCTFNIFKLIFEVNKEDAIDTLILNDHQNERTNESINENSKSQSVDMFLLFKKKGDDFGMKQRYMLLNIDLTVSDINYVFQGTSVYDTTTTNKYGLNPSTSEQIQEASAVLCMSLLSRDKLRIQFMLNLPIPKTEQPSYIENSLGMIMKKVLTRTKVFIENMK
jgi:hypothetical protein